MKDESSHEDLIEKYNKSQYKGRFGISYGSRSSKILSIQFGDYNNKKNVIKSKIQKESSIKRRMEFKHNTIIEPKSNKLSFNLINEIKEMEIERIYINNKQKEDDEEILPIINFKKVNKCSIVKYGIKKSTEDIEYSHCKTCDHNLVKPICLHCIGKCHKGHSIYYNIKKGKIKCCCGEKNHYMINTSKNIIDGDISCLCNEWNITAKLGFYFINKRNNPICFLCHNYCEFNNKKDKIVKLEGNKEIPACSCKNEEVHNSHKIICEKIINYISDIKELHILLNPIQFINMIFKSKKNFKLIFEDFVLFINNLDNPEKFKNFLYFSKFHYYDITDTNIYKTLLIFEKMVNRKSKNSYLYYYNEEVVNYFSFEVIKKLFCALEQSNVEDKFFRILMNKYLYLFHKFYINFKTQTLYKYKLNDLTNISFFQRMVIYSKNKEISKEFEQIVSFLLNNLIHIIYNGSTSLESIEYIKEIMAIFRKLASYNLLSNEQMSKICLNILKSFDYIRIIRNYFISNENNDLKNNNDANCNRNLNLLNIILLKLFYIIMKLIMNFIFNYNDNIINKIVYDKEKFPDINDITLDNVCFIFKRNELGRFISEINISILNYIQNYNNYSDKKLKLIQRIGIEIVENSLNKDDSYILNIISSLNQAKNYFKNPHILNGVNSQYYRDLVRQCNLLSNSFNKYFNFEITIEEMLDVVNNSLNNILGELIENLISLEGNEINKGFNHNQKIAIISSNYFSLISRVFDIIYQYENRNNIFNENKKKVNLKLNLFIQSLSINIKDEIIKKILYFYFCFILNSSVNSLLILSYSIFIEFTKIPDKYCQIIFKLFLTSIKNILSSDNEYNNNNFIVEITDIIKRIYNYLEKLFDDKNIKSNSLLTCVYYFLEIIQIAIFNSYSSIFPNFIYKIQYILVLIDKKYNLISKFFDMKDSELISQKKIIENKSDNHIFEYKNYISNEKNISFNNESNKNISWAFEFYQRTFLQKSFVIYIKLINDCFDFSIETDRKKIQEIINIDKIIFGLQYYKINLDLRTEFLRLLRKMLIDLKYSHNDNNLYTKIIINTKDNLKELKNNPLINNMEYPTKLLGFLKNFYNITAKCILEEKIKEKIKAKNNTKNIKSEIPENLTLANNNKRNTISCKNNFESFGGKAKLNSQNLYKLEKNNNDDMNENTMSTKKFIEFKEFDESVEKDKSNIDSNTSLSKSRSDINKNNYLNATNGVIIEESYSKQDEFDSETFKSKISSIKRNETNNDNRNNNHRMSLLEPNTNNNERNIKISKRSSYFIPNYFKNKFINDAKKTSNDINIPPNKKNNIDLDEESEIDSDDLNSLIDLITENNDEYFHSKCKDMKILEDAFNEKFYYIINYELDNFRKYVENIKLNSSEKIEYVRNYIENGVLIPLIFYFKKIFTLVHLFTGNQMIDLFNLVEKSLNLKLFISEFKINFWKNNSITKERTLEENDNILFEKNDMVNFHNYCYTKDRNSSIINGESFIDNKSIDSTNESLNYLNSSKISRFDYSSLYQIIEKELFSLIKDRKILNITENFKLKNNKSLNKKNMKNDEKFLKDKKHLPNIQKRLLKGLIIYKYSKLSCFNEAYSSFFSVLPEITLGYETNYRNLLVNLLINYGKEKNLKSEFSEISYFILFKLLSFQTIEIQNDIINLLGGDDSDDPSFLKDFGNILFNRIILLIIDYLNPPDKLIQSNYFVSCNLIYIFKLLCEEHNNFFQRHLVKSISYFYIKNNFSFFQFNLEEGNNSNSLSEEQSKSSSKIMVKNTKKKKKYNIPFYDFFLYLLIKIGLISNWENNYKKDYLHLKSFLYDLFTSILDLLTVIIQGSEPEILSGLCINLEKGVINIKDKASFDKHKKIDSFEFFIKNVKKILFHEKPDLQIINRIRIHLIDYITSIIEEKNCNEMMKKYIKKYINIDDIYKIISIIMKLYYLNKEKPKNFEKINKKPIVGLLSTKKLNIFDYKTIERKNSNYSPIFRPRMTNNKNNKKNQKLSIDISTSSNMKLMINSTIINRSLNRRLSLLNLNKKRHDLNIFKKIISNNEDNIGIFKRTKTMNNGDNERESMALELKIANFIFGKKLYQYFKNLFYNNFEFTETWEFKLSNSFYRYIKIILFKKNKLRQKINIDQIKKMIDVEGDIYLENLNDKDRANRMTNLKENLIYEKDLLEKYYIEKFFEDITSSVEVRENDGTNKSIIYTKLPVMKFLSKETRKEFKKNVNRDNETCKKNDLMRYIEYFFKEIKYYEKYHNKWDLFFLKLDFYYLILLSYLFALIYNLLLLFLIKGDNQISTSDILKERRQNKIKIQVLIDNSIKQWNLINIIFGYINLILNLILITLWVLYKLPLYFKIDQIKYREIFKINKNKKLCLSDNIYVLFKMGLFDRNYISMLLYEFIISIISITIEQSEIIFAFLLLPILIINKTLKNIMISVKLNYKPFFLTFCLAFIIMYIFSNIYFFFLNSDFNAELNYYNDNYCKTLIFSFLNALDNGLRARGGLGDSAKRLSFLKNTKRYIFRLILDDLFFLLIVIIMIDMVFGVIINSFDELRHRNQKYHKDKKNYCLICNSNRDSLEKIRLNFKEHIKKTHHIWNYVEYMISLKLEDIRQLNDINKYIREKLDKKDITWLPTYKDILIKNENNNDFEDGNLIVFSENFANYKIKNNSLISKY